MRDQKRLIAEVAAVIIAALIAVGAVVYYTHHGNSSRSTGTPIPMPSAAKGTFIDTGGYFSLKVPSGWAAETFLVNGGSVIALAQAENSETRLGPNVKDVESGNFVSVEVYKASPDLTAWKEHEASQAAANGITITDTTINGQPAFIESGNSNGNKSLTYFIGHGAYIVKVSMPVTQPSANIDNSQYVNQYQAIAQSLRILK